MSILLAPLRLTGAQILRDGAMQQRAISLADGWVTRGPLPEVDLSGYLILPGSPCTLAEALRQAAEQGALARASRPHRRLWPRGDQPSYFSRNASAGRARKSSNVARRRGCDQSHQASASSRSAIFGANRAGRGLAGTPATIMSDSRSQ